MVIRHTSREGEPLARTRRSSISKASPKDSNAAIAAGEESTPSEKNPHASSIDTDSLHMPLDSDDYEQGIVLIPQLIEWVADLLSWRDKTKSGMYAFGCLLGLVFTTEYKWSFTSMVAHALLGRMLYKSVVFMLVFTGVKASKVRVDALGPSNMYSLKYLLPWWRGIEVHDDPIKSVKAMLLMWVVAVVGRHISDAVTVSTAVLVTMVASYVWLQHLQADPKQVDTPQRSLHDIAEEQLQTLPKTRVLLVGVFLVWFAWRVVLKWFDYVALLVMGLAFLRSFSNEGTHTSWLDLASHIGRGIIQAIKHQLGDTARASSTPGRPQPGIPVTPPAPTPAGCEQPRPSSGSSIASPITRTSTAHAAWPEDAPIPRASSSMPPPQNSLQQRAARPSRTGDTTETSVIRKKSFMDTKLGPSRKKLAQKA